MRVERLGRGAFSFLLCKALSFPVKDASSSPTSPNKLGRRSEIWLGEEKQ
jgi:hypothetical protein